MLSPRIGVLASRQIVLASRQIVSVHQRPRIGVIALRSVLSVRPRIGAIALRSVFGVRPRIGVMQAVLVIARSCLHYAGTPPVTALRRHRNRVPYRVHPKVVAA